MKVGAAIYQQIFNICNSEWKVRWWHKQAQKIILLAAKHINGEAQFQKMPWKNKYNKYYWQYAER